MHTEPMTTTQTVQISDSVKSYQCHGRMTAGYAVALNGEAIYVGTFGECAEWGSRNLAAGAQWIVRDARGLTING